MRRSLSYRAQIAAFRLRRLLPAGLRATLGRLHQGYKRGPRLTRAELGGRRPLVVLPVIDWETRIQRPQHLLKRVAAAGHTVLYLDKSFAGGELGLRRLASGVFGVSAPGPRRFDLYREVAGPEERDALEAALRPLPVGGEAIMLVHWPAWGPAATALAQEHGWPLVYDCMDDHGSFAGVPPAIVAAEDELVRAADLVVTTSCSLEARLAPRARRVVRIPNGAEVEHFAAPPARDPIPRIRGPIVGYYGALAPWFDAALLTDAARRHPDWHFVLIGLDSGADLGPLEPFPNVHLLGEKPYRALPAYLHRFDVATIPFAMSDLTRAVQPVKLFEYLAAGKPVVASPLPEIQPFVPEVLTAAEPATFADALERAMARGGVEGSTRRAIASRHTWDNRAEAFLTALEALEAIQK